MKEMAGTDAQETTKTLLLQIGDTTSHSLAPPPPSPWHFANPHSHTEQQAQG